MDYYASFSVEGVVATTIITITTTIIIATTTLGEIFSTTYILVVSLDLLKKN